jgi:excisionase family DNA binding protein
MASNGSPANVCTVTVPRLLTVREVADVLRCSRSQVYSLIYAGTIPTAKIAGKTLCRAIDVEAYITSCLEASGLSTNEGEASAQAMPTTSDVLHRHRRNKRLHVNPDQ